MSFFRVLWDNHPTIAGDDPPCTNDGKSNFENQCAIRMGVCLQKSGIDTRQWNIRRCWYHTEDDAHILSAQELAREVSHKILPGIFGVKRYTGAEAFDKIRLMRGIIFFENYYGADLQGDHIDLWNGSRLTHWNSWPRIQFRIVLPGLWSDFAKSKTVWFWAVP